MAVPPLYHWYVGAVPPLTGDAVNVTFCPEQTLLPGLAAIETDAAPLAVIVNVIAFEVAVVVERHEAFEVNMQVIISLLASVVVP